ncbi:hypothetical protein [Neptunicoccus cionae]|uniref:Uncharacterized protein n=1 Tax=Neptunicoccus cionae TaxID=2035344 RepID=A0A916VPP8_9RHOB|nr:hypothetical protein [Amylibacter cionae]GGA17577.1 hypothetical protein GCM10011498_17730 [Amylibacter cionae]
MTTGFHFKQALMDQGWRQNVPATVTDTGNIETLVQGDNPSCYSVIENPVVPGMPNLQSNSFQHPQQAGNDASYISTMQRWAQKL